MKSPYTTINTIYGGRTTTSSGTLATTARETTMQLVLANIYALKPRNIKQCAIQAGYSKSYAHGNISSNKTFTDELESRIDYKKVFDSLMTLMEAKKIKKEKVSAEVNDEDIRSWIAGVNGEVLSIKKGTKHKHIVFSAPDISMRMRGLNSLFKLRKQY